MGYLPSSRTGRIAQPVERFSEILEWAMVSLAVPTQVNAAKRITSAHTETRHFYTVRAYVLLQAARFYPADPVD